MQVYLNKIEGIPDALTAMYMSRRTWTREREEHIRTLCKVVLDDNGALRMDSHKDALAEYNKLFETLLKMGKRHITMLKYIDLSFTVEGLHRAGQDDWDAHAKRFDNRIIRSSTRLAEYGENEISEWYQGKIIPTDEALKMLDIALPETIEKNGEKYVKAVNGYIRADLADSKDVKRGLYMLSIPSNFIYKVNLTEFAHVYKERGDHGTANPEVKLVAERSASSIQNFQPQITREVLMAIKN